MFVTQERAQRIRYIETKTIVMDVSAPKIKKVDRSLAFFCEYLPYRKWEVRRKIPGISCKEAIIIAQKTRIPKEVKLLMFRL